MTALSDKVRLEILRATEKGAQLTHIHCGVDAAAALARENGFDAQIMTTGYRGIYRAVYFTPIAFPANTMPTGKDTTITFLGLKLAVEQYMSTDHVLLSRHKDGNVEIVSVFEIESSKPKKEKTMQSYVGLIVFVERTEPGPNVSNYYDGEYIIVRQSPNYLYGISTKNPRSHDSGTERQLELTGKQRFTIISAKRDDVFVRQFAKEMISFGSAPEKRQWIESVYTSAKAAGERILKVLDAEKCEQPAVTKPNPVQDQLAAIIAAYKGMPNLASSEILTAFEVTPKETPKQRAARAVKHQLKASVGAVLAIGRADLEALVCE